MAFGRWCQNQYKDYRRRGIRIRRSFSTPTLNFIDPFLLLDEFGPQYVTTGKITRLLAHPHRGFETVTYMLEGRFEHKDSMGNSGKLSMGDVQWMTAGAGLCTQKCPRKNLLRLGADCMDFSFG